MSTDVLGPPYTARTIPLPPDDEGEVVATLVHRPAPEPTGRAVLYLHGFDDYFFQDHVAEFWVTEGYAFYALDLRKYGRSLLPHQTPNFCTDLAEYDAELDEAVRIIRDEDGHGSLTVVGHSTGGLVAALWADRRPGTVDALVLNSPWFDLNRPWLDRTVLSRAINALGARRPRQILQKDLPPHYTRSIHRDHAGEWDFDLTWKRINAFPIRAGWMRAIRQGHARLARGLDVGCPALVACSTRSTSPTEWSDEIYTADAVLNVRHIARRAPLLGRHVTIVRIPDGVHDLALSGPKAREVYFDEVRRWCRAYAAPAA